MAQKEPDSGTASLSVIPSVLGQCPVWIHLEIHDRDPLCFSFWPGQPFLELHLSMETFLQSISFDTFKSQATWVQILVLLFASSAI